jgi:hypothetical protein
MELLISVMNSRCPGQVRQVEIHVAETDLLIGMGLLEDYKLEIDVRPGSDVKITFLPIRTA